MKQALDRLKLQRNKHCQPVQDLKELDALRVKFLGKKGELTSILKQMGKLSPEERPVIGQLANQIRGDIEQDITTVC